ncbi:ABC-2 type transport system permease protein [Tangfeifania diversioriginum]|uniref:ABC-2 type transport system permease protein n=1 Tax=Tangfeifania diversioriginum TaxID=1168035 RepID=A0A1M6BF17_9BACT|nr:ABC transporter permease [Tangfeifania diversioriginum]SHI47332.1 ABC-2 type transport system permease protein [Tangfeifania diversioriginum]
MNKTILILKQEYFKRVKKKSFIILTLLVPLLFVGMFALIILLSVNNDKQERTIAVFDESALFLGELEQDEYTKFHFIPKEEYSELKSDLKNSEFYALLYIPENIYSAGTAQLISAKQVPIELTEKIQRRLSQFIEKDKRQKVIDEAGIPDLDDRLAATQTSVKLNTLKISETGEATQSSSEVAFIASYAMGFIIYFFVFMYGSMVMRSVMEEKKNRIVEVIISSVKPFQLMAGKIIGTALVGLTQVAIWVVVGMIVLTAMQSFFTPESAQQMGQSLMESRQSMGPAMNQDAAQSQVTAALEMVGNLNLGLILFTFVFYFLAGYLMYSSLLGAVGAAVDNDEDSQQMVLPITFPLIISIMLLFPIARNPEGPVAFWGSMIPFTSPVAMLARIPYGIPTWELLLSMFLLLLATLGAIWVAAKIYKTGLLMYGKKVNIKELIKWLRYKS